METGADHVIVTDQEDMAERMKTIGNGKGAHLVFDPVAGPFLEKLARAGALAPVVDRTFPLEKIADAHRYMESNRQKGKIVVTV